MLIARSTRRTFLVGAVAMGAAGALGAQTPPEGARGGLAHHVLVWLKNPESDTDRERVIEGMRTLAAIPSVRGLHIGVPAAVAQRSVVDGSFSVSLIVHFDDLAGHDAYQQHPVHLQLLDDQRELWAKVVIYDAMAV